MIALDYVAWMRTRANDTIPLPNQDETMSMEENLRVVPSEADTLREELEAVQAKIEKMEVRYERDLFLAKIDVDKAEGAALHAREEYSKLKTEYDIQNNDFKKLEASVKHMELRKTPTEWRREIQQAEDQQRNWAEREIEKEKKRNRSLVEEEKRKRQGNNQTISTCFGG
ncbi:hypothetical protein V6N13_020573 [Hibiscus sabdariffa]